MKITRKMLQDWHGCEKVEELTPADGLTPLEIARLTIPAIDRLRVLIHPEVIPNRELRLLACKFARDACARAGLTHQATLNAIAVAERHAKGEATFEELVAAYKAAMKTKNEISRLSPKHYAAVSARYAAHPKRDFFQDCDSRIKLDTAENRTAAFAQLQAAHSEKMQTREAIAWEKTYAAQLVAAEQLADVVAVLNRLERGAATRAEDYKKGG